MKRDLGVCVLSLCAIVGCVLSSAETGRAQRGRTTAKRSATAKRPAATKKGAATPSARPAATPTPTPTPVPTPTPQPTPAKLVEPFEGASAQEMAGRCVKLETEAGAIEIEMLPQSAPVTVRNFLNLVSVGAFDTTSFSRVVPGFVIQGGNLSTHQRLTPELAERSRRTIPDEPSEIKHVRGIVSMARPDAPNAATTNFFILVKPAPHLDGTFAAFGRVRAGMEVVDSINNAPVEGETPVNPVRVTRATVFPCAAGKPEQTIPPLD